MKAEYGFVITIDGIATMVIAKHDRLQKIKTWNLATQIYVYFYSGSTTTDIS